MPENDIETTEDLSLGQEIARSLIISAATSAGTLVAFVAVGLAYGKISEIADKRRAKKTEKIEK